MGRKGRAKALNYGMGGGEWLPAICNRAVKPGELDAGKDVAQGFHPATGCWPPRNPLKFSVFLHHTTRPYKPGNRKSDHGF